MVPMLMVVAMIHTVRIGTNTGKMFGSCVKLELFVIVVRSLKCTQVFLYLTTVLIADELIQVDIDQR